MHDASTRSNILAIVLSPYAHVERGEERGINAERGSSPIVCTHRTLQIRYSTFRDRQSIYSIFNSPTYNATSRSQDAASKAKTWTRVTKQPERTTKRKLRHIPRLEHRSHPRRTHTHTSHPPTCKKKTLLESLSALQMQEEEEKNIRRAHTAVR
ncbi:hypothetical protein EV363DRAFT_147830 [Boletus edulis]|nr:hypothetical protein EV363DRAFT_147830 [Boletus edulis]